MSNDDDTAIESPRAGEGTEIANIHMEVFGEERTFPIPFALGEQPIAALLPFAQQLTNELTAASISAVEKEGKQISCKAGCGACCRQLVGISLVEARDLARVVDEMPPERQAIIRERFAKGIAKLEASGLIDANDKSGNRWLLDNTPGATQSMLPRIAKLYFEQQIACPFLENESCGIYLDRPLVCREYHVTSPAERCAQIYQIGVDRVEVPRHIGEHLARTAHQVAGLQLQMIPLILSLEWTASESEAEQRKYDGLELVKALVTELNNPAPK
jgi:Fe-S-cluster containining protein